MQGLKIDVDQSLDELSGGMKRKLNLASIVIKIQIILFTTNKSFRSRINRMLEKYLVNEFRGFLVISHNRSF